MNNAFQSRKKPKAGTTEQHVRRVKTPTILQMEIVECGAASLAMVLAYHGLYVPLEKLRVECGVTRDGVRASNIVKAAAKLGLTAKGYRREPNQLKTMKPPMIVHWNFNHFVVLEGFEKGKAYINDPGSGRRAVTEEEFDLAFTGVVLTFAPTAAFAKGGQLPSMNTSLSTRLKGVKSAIVLLILVGLMMVIPGIVVPSFSKIFVDELLLAGRTDWLKPLLWCMGATALLQALLSGLQHKYLLRMETKLALLGASSFFWHILRLPVVFFQQRSAGDISKRMGSNDVVAAFISRNLAENVISIVTLVFYFVVMLSYNVVLSFIGLALASLSVAYFLYTSKKTEVVNSKLQQDFGKMYGISVSGLYIIETLKATASEDGFFSKWAGHHAKLLNGQQQMGRISSILVALPNFLSQVAEMLVLCIGGLQILEGLMTVGTLIAFQELLGSFMKPINNLTQMGMQVKQLKADMARLDDVNQYDVDPFNDPQKELPSNRTKKESYRKLDGSVEIRDLSFGYNVLEPPLIDHFSLSLTPGARVALVGASGSGKSTIAKIIAGVNRQWTGEILFDGVNKDALSRNTVSNSLSVVDQDISIFDGTIMENLTMWDSTIAEYDVLRAAKDACIHDDIITRPGGYQSHLNEGGTNFSGGQRQRLEIARALATNPSILIMDEATSALDVKTEQMVNDNIRRRGCTCIVIAHRLSTIRDCDEIIVLSRGKTVQRGTHEDMKHSEGPYATLIQSAV